MLIEMIRSFVRYRMLLIIILVSLETCDHVKGEKDRDRENVVRAFRSISNCWSNYQGKNWLLLKDSPDSVGTEISFQRLLQRAIGLWD